MQAYSPKVRNVAKLVHCFLKYSNATSAVLLSPLCYTVQL